MKALIIINLQNDYCAGPMGNSSAFEIIPKINKIRNKFDYVIFIKDSHSKYHTSFYDNGGIYPPHCIKNTYGEDINTGIIVKFNDIIVNKGTLNIYDSDSAFYNAKGKDISKKTDLYDILRTKDIEDIYLCGTCFETSIFPTAIDGYRFRFNVFIINDIFTYSNRENTKKGIEYLQNLGVQVIDLFKEE